MEDLISQLFTFIPPEQAAHVMAYLYAFSVLLSVARWALNRWVPPSNARVWIEALDWLAHVVAANSKPLAHRVAPKSRRSMPPLVVLALGALLASCGHVSTEDAFRTGLSTFAAVADPAYSVVMDACTTAERAVIERVKAEGYKPAYSQDFEVISASCHEARDVFEAVRSAHDKAATFVESGKLAKLLKGGGT